MTDPWTLTEEGRRAAEARMLDTFVIETSNGVAFDNEPTSPTHGQEVETFTTHFTTPGRIAMNGWPTQRDVGTRTSVEEVTELHIPAVSPPIPPNAFARCTNAHASSDAALEGRRFRIVGMNTGSSQKTARRMAITEVTT